MIPVFDELLLAVRFQLNQVKGVDLSLKTGVPLDLLLDFERTGYLDLEYRNKLWDYLYPDSR